MNAIGAVLISPPGNPLVSGVICGAPTSFGVNATSCPYCSTAGVPVNAVGAVVLVPPDGKPLVSGVIWGAPTSIGVNVSPVVLAVAAGVAGGVDGVNGMRAYSFKVTDATGVGGHALPGDRVDVVLLRDLSSEEFGQAFLTGINKNLDKDEKAKFVNQLVKLGDLFNDIEAGVKTPSNAALVEKAGKIISLLGGKLATPDEALQILGLPKRKP